MTLPIYIDIDGTLTSDGEKPAPHAFALEARVEALRRLIDSGEEVVIWSGRGGRYAWTFAAANGLLGPRVSCVGKPRLCVDDNPSIRPHGLLVERPVDFFDDADPNLCYVRDCSDRRCGKDHATHG